MRPYLDRVPLLVLTLGFFLVILGVQLCANWTISQLRLQESPWSASVMLRSEVYILSLATALFHALITQLRQRQRDIALLNHELRNALQVILYAVSLPECKNGAKAQEAVRRMSRTIQEVSAS